MLSYRHGFHAGNFADVMKHAGLLALVDRLMEKPRPITLMDSHAGPGLYDLAHAFAEKTGEWREGVGRLLALSEPPGAWSRYRAAIEGGMQGAAGKSYPGSPELLRRQLRDRDRLILCELHGTDAPALKRLMREDVRVQVHLRDGFEAMGALLPPEPRAGALLIDPPYEMKDDYARLPDVVAGVARRWAEGAILIWYPLLPDHRHAPMLAALEGLHPKGWLRWECRDGRRKEGRVGMTGAGLMLLNPPWRLAESWAALSETLPAILFDGEGESSLSASS